MAAVVQPHRDFSHPPEILSTIMRDYEYVKHLGSGSYGSVCAARHRATGRLVAVKRIKNVWARFDSTRRAVLEIYIARNFEHRCIVPILDVLEPVDRDNFDDLFVVYALADADLDIIIRKTDQFFLVCAPPPSFSKILSR